MRHAVGIGNWNLEMHASELEQFWRKIDEINEAIEDGVRKERLTLEESAEIISGMKAYPKITHWKGNELVEKVEIEIELTKIIDPSWAMDDSAGHDFYMNMRLLLTEYLSSKGIKEMKGTFGFDVLIGSRDKRHSYYLLKRNGDEFVFVKDRSNAGIFTVTADASGIAKIDGMYDGHGLSFEAL